MVSLKFTFDITKHHGTITMNSENDTNNKYFIELFVSSKAKSKVNLNTNSIV